MCLHGFLPYRYYLRRIRGERECDGFLISVSRLIYAAQLLLFMVCFSSCSSLRETVQRPSLGLGHWTSYDGKVMPYQRWLPTEAQRPQAIVIAVHGLSGASSDFWFIADALPKQGIGVYAYDLRGQGNDPVGSQRGDIRSANQWLHDLETFHLLVKKAHPRLPIFWYGESAGSLICLHTAARLLSGHQGPAGIVFASPVAGLRMTVSDFRRWLLEMAARLAPRTRFSLGELAGMDESKIQVTSQTTHGEQMSRTPHHVSSFSLRLLAELGRLMDNNAESARQLRMPVLFLASPHDVISSPEQVQSLFSQVRSTQKRLLWYTRSHHLLLHDVQRAEVSRDLYHWISRVLSQRRANP
jgi:acylglycerol lipase